ncbi:monooxygenase [Chondromyces apiculatus]|uniref:Copper type II ascorbate-dependent monooxygenase C-terminal domain-containing protein n=1 Tax=Chondromyces apiculatus DSM 436 TaxID=1192034 RepID=A0A017TBR8_9BACT|nr:hypothetical protein [Chondromyces apiculatus]EYF06367.1 Hypothetical protein CAP_1897 [Chondromyces apiculatus DSM 436]
MRTIAQLAGLGLIMGLLGCGGAEDGSSVEPDPNDDDLLAPPAEGQGAQFRMISRLDPGMEAEHCQFMQAPPEGMHVNRDEVRYTSGSHHVLLYATSYTEIPTAKDDGTEVDTSGVFDCSDGATNGWSVTKLVGGSQNGEGTSLVSFPPDVAMYIPPRAVLLMNAHYINASGDVLEPEVAINLHSIPAEQVKQEGDILFLYNAFIKVGAQSVRTARMRCPVWSDITIANVQSHMHARGKGYFAALSSGAPFYESDRWEDVEVKSFEGGFEVRAGEVLDYACDYQNHEQRDVYQGPRSTDEMCMLIGSYYPADPATSNCAADPDDVGSTNNMGAEWVGDGVATCAETLGCIQTAFTSAGDGFESLQGCVVDSDPAVSKEMSDTVRCLVLSLQRGQDPMSTCSAEISACAAK